MTKDFNYPDIGLKLFKKLPVLFLGGKDARVQITELNHGDVIYIPSGYWHYVMYDDIGFSMALRAFPRKSKPVLKLLYNLLVLRTIDGLIHKVVGQSWNERNERVTLKRT